MTGPVVGGDPGVDVRSGRPPAPEGTRFGIGTHNCDPHPTANPVCAGHRLPRLAGALFPPRRRPRRGGQKSGSRLATATAPIAACAIAIPLFEEVQVQLADAPAFPPVAFTAKAVERPDGAGPVGLGHARRSLVDPLGPAPKGSALRCLLLATPPSANPSSGIPPIHPPVTRPETLAERQCSQQHTDFHGKARVYRTDCRTWNTAVAGIWRADLLLLTVLRRVKSATAFPDAPPQG